MTPGLSLARTFGPPASAFAADPVVRPLRPIGPPAGSAQELVFRSREEWQDGLRRFLLPLECSVADAQSFQCRAVVGRLAGHPLAELRVDASRLVRRALHLGDALSESVQVVWVLGGRGRFRQGPNSATLEAGAWTLLDPSREYTIELDRGARVLALLVPRSDCPAWLPALSLLSARALAAGGAAQIAAATLGAVLREATPLDRASQASLHASVVTLVERALAAELDARGLEAQPERAIPLAHVQTYIQTHLANTSLNVDRVATVFGVSRRKLYNLFLPSGVTPHAYIQSARLERACALLQEQSVRSGSVAGVARQCGFSDPAHFSRAFHARHGVAPTAWRERCV